MYQIYMYGTCRSGTAVVGTGTYRSPYALASRYLEIRVLVVLYSRYSSCTRAAVQLYRTVLYCTVLCSRTHSFTRTPAQRRRRFPSDSQLPTPGDSERCATSLRVPCGRYYEYSCTCRILLPTRSRRLATSRSSTCTDLPRGYSSYTSY